MFELSVNLEYMFQEAGENLTDRVAAAAAAGFRKVEIFTTGERDVPALAKALRQHGVKLWTVVADPRTKLVDPSTHETFLGIFRRAASYAGCSVVRVSSLAPVRPCRTRSARCNSRP
jgi:hydroxypyruvate isomerase